MSTSPEERPSTAQPAQSVPPPTSVAPQSGMGLGHGTRELIRWVCTNNPFYVLSAYLFLVGLWMSFGAYSETAKLMSGLAGYTLLLAVTALVLGRFAQVWDDVRTILLLVVLMFLATSVTLDSVIVADFERGIGYYVGGLLFAMLLSEALLWGMRLSLPLWFRLPYHLILALFFLYPIALGPYLHEPRGESIMWGIFLFCPLAALVFLTLIPAIHRGRNYLAKGPFPWPLYPWTLFGLLALAVPVRSFIFSWSMHQLDFADIHRLIFGWYFLIPFGFTIAILLLEAGLVERKPMLTTLALFAPLAFLLMARAGHRYETLYQLFLDHFQNRLGGDPLYVTLLATVGFYFYAAMRKAPLATEAMTASLLLLTVVGPHSMREGVFVAPRAMPLVAIALLQLAIGIWQLSSARCLVGGIILAASVLFAFPEQPFILRAAISFHTLLGMMLMLAVLFDDACARWLRPLAGLLGLAGVAVLLFGRLDIPKLIPVWCIEAYPLTMALGLACVAALLWHRVLFIYAGATASLWLLTLLWAAYVYLRAHVKGIDYLLLSLGVFALAIFVSITKSVTRARFLSSLSDD